MPSIRKGQTVDAPVKSLKGPKEHRVKVATPCCGVTYHLSAEDITYLQKGGKRVPVACGKNFNGRGRRGDGCGWYWDVLFIFGDDGLAAASSWTA